MARIAGVDLPNKKRAEIGLTYIFGIGRSKSLKILEEAKIDKNKKVKALSEDEVDKIRRIIEKREKIEGDLRKEVADAEESRADVADELEETEKAISARYDAMKREQGKTPDGFLTVPEMAPGRPR